MRFLDFLYPAALALCAFADDAQAWKKKDDSVLLSKVKSLTLRSGQKTTHRRVSAIPQLRCTGGSGKGLYEVDVLRCKNQGSDYDDENIQWTCTASLPSEFKLGSTDVICEGYDSPDDPFILKGSCGVEYRLMLTDEGERRYGQRYRSSLKNNSSDSSSWATILFWILFLAAAGFIIYSLFKEAARRGPNTGRVPQGGGWFGGGGGGHDDPPPPYDYPGYRKPPSSTYRNYWGARSSGNQQGWTPGFWTGTAAGTAAGYAAGRRSAQTQQQPAQPAAPAGRSGWYSRTENGEGSSSGPSTRHESTGFGSTNRR